MISHSWVRRGWSSRWIPSTLSKLSFSWTSSAASVPCPSTWESNCQRTTSLQTKTPSRPTKPYSDRICWDSTTALSLWKVPWERMPTGVCGWQRTTLKAAHSGKVLFCPLTTHNCLLRAGSEKQETEIKFRFLVPKLPDAVSETKFRYRRSCQAMINLI